MRELLALRVFTPEFVFALRVCVVADDLLFSVRTLEPVDADLSAILAEPLLVFVPVVRRFSMLLPLLVAGLPPETIADEPSRPLTLLATLPPPAPVAVLLP